MTFSGVAFDVLAVLTLGSAGCAVFFRSRVHAAVAALVTTVGMAGLSFLLGATLFAVLEIAALASGVLVISISASAPVSGGFLGRRLTDVDLARRALPPLLALVPAAAGFMLLAHVAGRTEWLPRQIGSTTPATASLGDAFLGELALAFELALLVLVAGFIGAIVIARGHEAER